MPKDVTKDTYWNNMTNEQRAVMSETVSVAEQEYLFCDTMYKRAVEARVKLPHTNEDGEPVMNGANGTMYYFEQYWHKRRDAVKDMLSDEFIKEYDVNTFLRYC